MFDSDFILALFCAVVAVFCLGTWLRVLSLLVTDAEERKAAEDWWKERAERKRKDQSQPQSAA